MNFLSPLVLTSPPYCCFYFDERGPICHSLRLFNSLNTKHTLTTLGGADDDTLITAVATGLDAKALSPLHEVVMNRSSCEQNVQSKGTMRSYLLSSSFASPLALRYPIAHL